MLQAALLHDTIEDTELTEEMINGIFGAGGSKTCRRPNSH
ncbi:guanosine-3',5'-bis(diphosphate) 3'-pyrophosphohydrolase [Rickettsia rickettsii]|uniref:Guanosine-3',5'-bis(Diphosphate) 3'-pyrophosphohydrolase n=3 Tax=spotted fever group TaxID=114277 RepID=B0BUN2_RICRO|nr:MULTISPECIES: guanosine-3',5'-bis(diphosphate) 3'-pyrophosphohydrolase [spotted fever group]ABV76567.1 30S ribosomal protein S20 [Rickettsia rickettsii str. 'Sheila Smith']ABY72942.1 guanosine-3',5'-bis(Diphosphate) 3'-pyrophosphohydrolase [Rickettsia rickettsii str. Iowa]AFB21861.1 guanosine-3',5'-bis(diphosphate) 3'-pyrophosphohydrolase [Rickettsia rickettsii str. Brazil]AFB23919.1 guanosine-3',5'-bis(diphosphate) 3'-pyrophosphohydrolase [Rickettsia rickettsii str. Colombia]AFB25265.1 gua